MVFNAKLGIYKYVRWNIYSCRQRNWCQWNPWQTNFIKGSDSQLEQIWDSCGNFVCEEVLEVFEGTRDSPKVMNIEWNSCAKRSLRDSLQGKQIHEYIHFRHIHFWRVCSFFPNSLTPSILKRSSLCFYCILTRFKKIGQFQNVFTFSQVFGKNLRIRTIYNTFIVDECCTIKLC